MYKWKIELLDGTILTVEADDIFEAINKADIHYQYVISASQFK